MNFNKKVFLVRHGNQKDNDSSNPGLSKFGYEQAEKLAEQIQRKIGGCKNIIIFSSPSLRAIETAEVISKRLKNLPIRIEENLSENKHNLDIAWLIDKIQSTSAEVIITITHYPYVKELPEVLGFPEYFPGNCEGVLFDEKITKICI